MQVHVGAPTRMWNAELGMRNSRVSQSAGFAYSEFALPSSRFPSPRMQKVTQPAFHAGPSRCEPGRGHLQSVDGGEWMIADAARTTGRRSTIHQLPSASKCWPWCRSSTPRCGRGGTGASPVGQPNFRSLPERQPNQTRRRRSRIVVAFPFQSRDRASERPRLQNGRCAARYRGGTPLLRGSDIQQRHGGLPNRSYGCNSRLPHQLPVFSGQCARSQSAHADCLSLETDPLITDYFSSTAGLDGSKPGLISPAPVVQFHLPLPISPE